LIRILTERPICTASWRRWVFHPDPDLLAVGIPDQSRKPSRASEFEAFTRAVSSIRVGHIHKLTASERLAETARSLARHLKGRGRVEIQLLDVGGSDGTTTLDAVEDLSRALRLPVFATLIDRYVRLERRRDGWLREYCMSDGSPVMLRIGPLGLQLSSIESTRNPVSRWLGRAYLRHRERCGLPELDATFPLIHPAVSGNERIRLIEWNVLDANPELRARFDAVRASNILNEDYFSHKEIECVLTHIHGYLVEDGLLLVSRNHLEEGVEIERGSVWRKTHDGFLRVDDFGSGSYVACIVDALEVAGVDR
jgi:hypothetical protein